MKTYDEFRQAIAVRESSGKYNCVNSLGYLGAYQFGKPRLWDLGISIDGWTPQKIDGLPKNMRTISKEDFLKDIELQDGCFRKHVGMLARSIQKRVDARDIEKYTLSGLVAGAHLKGIGGVLDFVQAGNDNQDGYGTKISEYITTFAGYDIA